jgi:hypothetical protein
VSPQFREQFASLTPAEVVTVLGWLLDTGIGDPDPDLPDDMIDALQPLSRAYRQTYSALIAAARSRQADKLVELLAAAPIKGA